MTRRIWPLVFSLAALVAPARAATNEVSLSPFAKSLWHQLGAIRGDYFVPGRPVSAQVMMGLGIPDPGRKLADGRFLRSGCRPHSCDEKAAVIVTAKGEMLAAGLIHFRCGGNRDKRIPAACDLHPHLAIFMKQNNNQPVFVQELKDWAAREGYSGAAETQILR